MRPRLLTPACLLTFVLGVWAAAGAAPITYIHDELGRLVGVVDPAGDTVTYTYDAAGNLLAISRHPSSEVSIIDFSPREGPEGTAVTLFGTGFTTQTPSQNAVTFNGVPATVTSATATQLGTSVPVGATTGPVAVTSPSGSATSSEAFTVAPSGAPTITSVTPQIGPAGTAVTITGTNFEPTRINNQVIFNTTVGRATLSSTTTTTIGATVPAQTGSGRIAVATPGGQAISAQDFFIPPPPRTAADVQASGRMTVGGSSQAFSLTAANKLALFVFDGTVGQRVTVGMTGVSLTSSTVSVLTLTNATLAITGVGAGGGSLDPPVLPATGTYAVMVSSAYTGGMTLTLSEDLPGTIAINGPSLPVTISRPGQRARITFTGTAGQRVSLHTSAVSIYVSALSVLTPAGTTLTSANVFTSGGTLELPALPATGTYTIVIDPTGTYTGSMTLTLSEEVTGTIVIGGAALPVSLARVGQRARISFSGTAGQRLGLGMTGNTIFQSDASVLNPDGTTLVAPSFVFGSANALHLPALPATGSYAILVDPRVGYTGSMTLTLSAEVTGTIAIDGAAVPVSLTRAGQGGRVSFSGTAGQRLSLGLTGVTIGQSDVSITRPDGTTLAGPVFVTTSGGVLHTPVLPTTGTYTAVVTPRSAGTGTMTLTLSSPVAGTMTIGGPGVPMTSTRPGQRFQVTFNGSAGQLVTVRLTGSTLGCVWGYLLKPDGTTLTSKTSCSASFDLTQSTLPTTGTYTVLVDPGITSGSITVQVTSP